MLQTRILYAVECFRSFDLLQLSKFNVQRVCWSVIKHENNEFNVIESRSRLLLHNSRNACTVEKIPDESKNPNIGKVSLTMENRSHAAFLLKSRIMSCLSPTFLRSNCVYPGCRIDKATSWYSSKRCPDGAQDMVERDLVRRKVRDYKEKVVLSGFQTIYIG